MNRRGILFLVSGPSGSGKTTLCRRLAEEGLARYSISCTTRAPRPGERDGVDYFFLTPEQFAEQVAAGAFLEHAEVHGHCYGTLRSEVLSHLAAGTDVVMDIDVQGATQVRHCADASILASLVDLFVMPATAEELEQRLNHRATDAAEVIRLRLENARREMSAWPQYQFLLISTTREQDYLQFVSLLRAERLRVSRLLPNSDPAP